MTSPQAVGALAEARPGAVFGLPRPGGQAGSLRYDGVSIDFHSVRAVSGVSLAVAPREFVSIVGPSGCGKTTLLNLAAGLLPPGSARGTVLVGGKPPVAGNRDIAYMLARDALCPWRTALENAELGTEIRGMAPAERRGRARSLLAALGLAGFEDSYPKMLSHGMRQRVALARTFAMDASILLMDEPFGALDAFTKLQLEEALLSLWQREQRTVLFITHDLAEAIMISDRVVVMSSRPGRVAADVRIDLPRPRDVRSLQRDPAFQDIYAHIWRTLEDGLAP